MRLIQGLVLSKYLVLTVVNKSEKEGTSLVVQWVGFQAPTGKGPVQSLVWELKSHKLCRAANLKKEGKRKLLFYSLLHLTLLATNMRVIF